jgi:hypothetical protein
MPKTSSQTTSADRDRVVREYGAIEGGNQTMDRLAEHLARMEGTK